VDVLKALGSSVSPLSVLLVLLLAGMALFVWPRTRRFATRWLLWVTGIHIVFGLPVVATALASRLPAVSTPAPATAPRSATTLVVFDGDNRRGRLAETLRWLDDTGTGGAPVWILGDRWLVDQLVAAGHERSRFRHETGTGTTREQMDWVARFVGDHRGAVPAVVVSRLQAPRVAALAEAAGIQVALVRSAVDREPPTAGWRVWVPSYIALRTSRDAIYEHAALVYYRWKGWI
jgi:uncharacterized SAM-binding protein YcdF (DUF218 family)